MPTLVATLRRESKRAEGVHVHAKRWMVLLAFVVALAGCSAEADVATDSSAGFSVLGSLEQIPASAMQDAAPIVQIFAADLFAAGEQVGLTPPTDPLDFDQFRDFLTPLTGRVDSDPSRRLYVPIHERLSGRAVGELEGFAVATGFSPASVSSFVGLQAPPADFLVVSGVTLRDDLPEVAPGVRTIGQGSDGSVDPGRESPAQPLGRPLRVAESEGRIAMSPWTAPLVDWVEGPGTSTLADDPVLSSLARRLDIEAVVSAALVIREEEDPFRAAGLGWVVDERGSIGVMVLTYASAVAAENDLARVEQAFSGTYRPNDRPISERLTLDSIEARSTEIVAVVGYPDESAPGELYKMLVRRYGVFEPAQEHP